MAARNLALGIALGALVSVRAVRELAVVVVVVVLVEIGDTISAIADADWAQASGILIAVAFAWAAWRLLRQPAAPAGYRSAQ
jgi:type VI protein secretion system component VasK